MYLFYFPVVMKISRHNKKTANFPPTDDCIFFFPVVIKISRTYKKMQISRQNQKLIQQHNPPDRRLYLFFSGRNRQNRAPIRQTTVPFFSPVVMYLFFSGRNENFPPQQKYCQFPTTRKKVPPAHAKRVYSFLCQ